MVISTAGRIIRIEMKLHRIPILWWRRGGKYVCAKQWTWVLGADACHRQITQSIPIHMSPSRMAHINAMPFMPPSAEVSGSQWWWWHSNSNMLPEMCFNKSVIVFGPLVFWSTTLAFNYIDPNCANGQSFSVYSTLNAIHLSTTWPSDGFDGGECSVHVPGYFYFCRQKKMSANLLVSVEDRSIWMECDKCRSHLNFRWQTQTQFRDLSGEKWEGEIPSEMGNAKCLRVWVGKSKW